MGALCLLLTSTSFSGIAIDVSVFLTSTNTTPTSFPSVSRQPLRLHLKSGNMTRITYAIESFPRISETFVLDEIEGVVASGKRVAVVSRTDGQSQVWDDPRRASILTSIEVIPPDASLRQRPLLSEAVSAWIRSGQRPCGLRPSSTLRRAKVARKVLNMIRRICSTRPDLIVSHFGYDNAVAAALAGRQCGVPVIQWFHGSDMYSNPHRSIRWITDRAASIVTNSQFSAKLLKELGVRSEVCVAGLGVDTKLFSPAADGEQDQEPMIVSVGRLGHNKGMDRLLRTFAGVAPAVASRLCIIGDGPDRPRLEELANELGIGHLVDFAGALPPRGVAAELRRAWIMMLMSDQEGLGVALMEAHAAGLPVIGTRVGGVPEVVEHGVTGFLYEISDQNHVQAAASGAIRLLLDADLRRRMGAAARVRAERHFSQDSSRLRFLGIVDKVMSERSRS